MVNHTDTIHIFKSDEYPHGYTIARNRTEANNLAVELVLYRTTSKGVSVEHGLRHWKTGKPAYYIVSFDEPYEIKPEYKSVTGLI